MLRGDDREHVGPPGHRPGRARQPLDLSASVYTVSRADRNPSLHAAEGTDPTGSGGRRDLPLPGRGIRPGGVGALPCRYRRCIQGRSDEPRDAQDSFHIETDAPVAAYSIFPYGGESGKYPTATVLLPVSAWDKTYIAVEAGRFGLTGEPRLDERTVEIVANEDGTEVTMRPGEAILQGRGSTPAPAGLPVKWTLSRGEVLQIRQRPLLTGSPIVANKPVGMFGGSSCTYMPSTAEAC